MFNIFLEKHSSRSVSSWKRNGSALDVEPMFSADTARGRHPQKTTVLFSKVLQRRMFSEGNDAVSLFLFFGTDWRHVLGLVVCEYRVAVDARVDVEASQTF